MEKLPAGPLLFLYIVLPCGEDKVLTHKMSQEDLELLKWHTKKKKQPEISLLRRCYKEPVIGLELYATAKGKNAWSSGTVYKFFLYHHGHSGNCAIRIGEIGSVSTNCVYVLVDGKTIRCFDTYCLQPNRGDKVLIHRNTVCIVVKRAQ